MSPHFARIFTQRAQEGFVENPKWQMAVIQSLIGPIRCDVANPGVPELPTSALQRLEVCFSPTSSGRRRSDSKLSLCTVPNTLEKT